MKFIRGVSVDRDPLFSIMRCIMQNKKSSPIRGKRSRYSNNTPKNNAGKNNTGKDSKPSSYNKKKNTNTAKPTEKAQKLKKNQSIQLSENAQYIQWFPGHMTRTKRQIQSDLKLVDAVAEIIDARLPQSSRNPDLDSLIGSKPRLILMNKCDLANPSATAKWVEYFRTKGIKTVELDCKSGKGIGSFTNAVREILAHRIAAWEAKGMKNHSLRVMVVGIPNVGKSSFINRISKSTKAKVEDRPGVTRGNQWFTIDKNIELLDTPGVLWPKFDDQSVGEKLAFTGAVKDQIMDTEQLALRLLEYLKRNVNPVFKERFSLTDDELTLSAHELLSAIAKKRGMLVSGGEPDTERAAVMVLDEFRAAKLGRITLEIPDKRGDA